MLNLNALIMPNAYTTDLFEVTMHSNRTHCVRVKKTDSNKSLMQLILLQNNISKGVITYLLVI